MKVVIDKKAAYLIFPLDRANIAHSADELAAIAHALEDTALYKLILRAFLAVENRMKGVESSWQSTATKGTGEKS